MKKKQTLKTQPVTILLDRSGSMSSVLDSTIEGVNAFLADQALDEIPSRATMIQFDSEDPCEVIVSDCPIGEVLPLNRETFVPRGGTPLFDAIARSVSLAEATANGVAPIFVIVTDGEENSSREVSGDFVQGLIAKKENLGWRFVYLGANQDAIREAAQVGIRADHALTFSTDHDKMQRAYGATARVVRDMKRGVETNFVLEERLDQRD